MDDSSSTASAKVHAKKRVRSGCVTCRIRRVKCDETKPHCHRCTSTGRTCDGYTNTTLPRKRPPATAADEPPLRATKSLPLIPKQTNASLATRSSGLSNIRVASPYRNDGDARLLDFFLSCTLPNITSTFASSFWNRSILQQSFTEPAIRHGVLALSSLHESLSSPEHIDDAGAVTKGHALKHYGAALAASKELVSAGLAEGAHTSELDKILTACVVFTAYENLAGNLNAASTHMRSGHRVLQIREDKAKQRRNPTAALVEDNDGDVDDVARILSRFDLNAMTLSPSDARYMPSSAPPAPPAIPSDPFKTLTAARDFISGTLHSIFGLPYHIGNADSAPLLAELYVRLAANIGAWPRLSAPLLRSRGAEPGTMILQLHYITTRLVHSVLYSSGDEGAWDGFVTEFAEVVAIADRYVKATTPSLDTHPPVDATGVAAPNALGLTAATATASSATDYSMPAVGAFVAPPQRKPLAVSMDTGIVSTLFFVALRCRDPQVRRAAIAVLDASPRREASWDSRGAARVAEAAVRLEEQGLTNVRTVADVPVENRLRVVMPEVDYENRKVKVTWMMGGSTQLDSGRAYVEEQENSWYVSEDVIDF